MKRLSRQRLRRVTGHFDGWRGERICCWSLAINTGPYDKQDTGLDSSHRLSGYSPSPLLILYPQDAKTSHLFRQCDTVTVKNTVCPVWVLYLLCQIGRAHV